MFTSSPLRADARAAYGAPLRILPRGATLATLGVPVVGLLNGLYLPLLARNSALYWAAEMAGYLLVPMLSAVCLSRVAGFGPSQYGFCTPFPGYTARDFLKDFAVCAVILGVATFGAPGLLWPLLGQVDQAERVTYVSMLPTGILRIPMIGYLAISAAVVEEGYYRGLLEKLLVRDRTSRSERARYVLLSGTLFALIHWEHGVIATVSMLLFGALAAWLYLKLRTLYPLIVAHALVYVAATT